MQTRLQKLQEGFQWKGEDIVEMEIRRINDIQGLYKRYDQDKHIKMEITKLEIYGKEKMIKLQEKNNKAYLAYLRHEEAERKVKQLNKLRQIQQEHVSLLILRCFIGK